MGEEVTVYVYKLLDSFKFNKKSEKKGKIPAVYHTSIVVFNKEYTFNNTYGICIKNLENQTPDLIESLGVTKKTVNQLEKYIECLQSEWKTTDYELLNQNCQDFCIALCNFLGVEGFPEYVRKLPETAKKIFGDQDNLIKSAGGTIFTAILVGIGALVLGVIRSSAS